MLLFISLSEIYASKSAEEKLAFYLELGKNFENPPHAEIQLGTQSYDNPEINAGDIAATTALQCYAKGRAIMKPRRSEKDEERLSSTLEAGHHTTRMHTSYTYHIEATRSLIHDVLHQYPFFNSEQQSQRFVEAKDGYYIVPENLTPAQKEFYIQAADYMNREYGELLKDLRAPISARLKDMYPKIPFDKEPAKTRMEEKATKIAQEVARYVLPIGQLSQMFYTINHLQLLRLFHACELPNMTDEARYLVACMVQEVAKEDPSILDDLRDPLPPIDTISTRKVRNGNKVAEKFDAALGEKTCLLTTKTENPRKTLADAVRIATMLDEDELSDEEAITAILDPVQNPVLADIYDVGMHDPATSALRQVYVNFLVKLSHTADSQRQRHRTTPGATPPIQKLYTGRPDYITPMVIAGDPELNARYAQIMNTIFSNVEQALTMGIPEDIALLLLPNALAVRLMESGDLFDWAHRLRQRLCYLAQEEICFISIEQAKAFLELFPEGKYLFAAPCATRKAVGLNPPCPEGTRSCAIPVFQLELEQYAEKRLV